LAAGLELNKQQEALDKSQRPQGLAQLDSEQQAVSEASSSSNNNNKALVVDLVPALGALEPLGLLAVPDSEQRQEASEHQLEDLEQSQRQGASEPALEVSGRPPQREGSEQTRLADSVPKVGRQEASERQEGLERSQPLEGLEPLAQEGLEQQQGLGLGREQAVEDLERSQLADLEPVAELAVLGLVVSELQIRLRAGSEQQRVRVGSE
jgi:hypothetical protein